MRLTVLAHYQNTARQIDVYPGQVIEVPDALGEYLLADSPGSFEGPAGTAPQRDEDGNAKPFDYPPTGRTLPVDPVPNVVDKRQPAVVVVSQSDPSEGSASGAQAPSSASAEPQPASGVAFDPDASFAAEFEDEDEERKSLDTPTADKAIKRAPRNKGE